MTPKETLIQAIEQSPDELILALLDLVRLWQQQIVTPSQEQPRVYYEGDVLVVDTEAIANFNFNHFIDELREERIQKLGFKRECCLIPLCWLLHWLLVTPYTLVV